jgi:hypothetical protein
MHKELQKLRDAYKRCKQTCQEEISGQAASAALKQFVVTALRFLEKSCVRIGLVSRVEGKDYMAFRRKDAPGGISRPANVALFRLEADAVIQNWDNWVQGGLIGNDLAAMSYTACLAPCLALELFDRQNKKGPATFFECVIGHVFARALHRDPRKSVTLNIEGMKARMTMDFIFHLSEKRSLHLAVKMSTRERVVQAWAHQRILDAAYGLGAYTGMMVLFGETKLASKSLEVVEVCVPDQWLVYQSLLSHLERIYYFDIPQRYLTLTAQHPDLIQIKPFADFFTERDQVLGR